MHRTAIASHRGGALLWPENSFFAFHQALALPAEQLELDVHLSADGHPVVIHDATLDRTTDGTGPVHARSLSELHRLRPRGAEGETLLTLAEAAVLVREAGRVLRLEIKADAVGRPYPGSEPRCLEVLDAAAMRNHTVLMGFAPRIVAEAAAAGGFARIVLLLEARTWRGMGMPAAVALARASGAGEIGLPIAELDARTVAALREAGLAVSAWGTNHEPTIRQALTLGLDAMATDDPVLALRLRSEARPAPKP